MRYKTIVFAAALSFGSADWAMAQSTAPNPTTANPPNSPTGAPYAGTSANPDSNGNRAGNAGLERGANSFTEGQARRRIEDHGYTSVGSLHKDQNSIWQAEATKDGRRVRVGVDFRGNVVEENR
jgi:periplasmic protein CpxP/Spy